MSYIPLLLTTGLVVLFSLFVWFYHKTTKLNAELGFLSNNYLEASKQNQILQQEKISYIQKIEQLSSKVDYQNQLIAEADKARQESYASAKNALFDLGNELSKQLIEIHRRENQEARELSEKNISGATSGSIRKIV
jgi:DNA recombination protein RmuC